MEALKTYLKEVRTIPLLTAKEEVQLSRKARRGDEHARKAMIRAYEARLDQLLTHPVFDYRCSWRAAIRLQARLFSRWLRGDIPRFQSIVTR